MRIAVVTGASSGMGREFVKQLDSQSVFDEIWVIARREDRLNKLKDDFGKIETKVIPMDITLNESLIKLENLLNENQYNLKFQTNLSPEAILLSIFHCYFHRRLLGLCKWFLLLICKPRYRLNRFQQM